MFWELDERGLDRNVRTAFRHAELFQTVTGQRAVKHAHHACAWRLTQRQQQRGMPRAQQSFSA